jgi:rubrerythrin
MATEQRNQQGTGKHPHKSTKEPWPHQQGQAKTKRKKTSRSTSSRGTGQARSSQARGSETASESSGVATTETEEGLAPNAEAEEGEDDQHVSTLLAIAQMDSEAAVAYETAAELVSEPEVRARLQEFASDHRRHIDDIGALIEQIGGDAELAAPPPETSVFSMLALAVASMGDRAALMALVGNEQFTNATYSTALELVTNAEALALLQRNLQDEQRHISWLSRRASAPAEDLEDDANEDDS